MEPKNRKKIYNALYKHISLISPWSFVTAWWNCHAVSSMCRTSSCPSFTQVADWMFPQAHYYPIYPSHSGAGTSFVMKEILVSSWIPLLYWKNIFTHCLTITFQPFALLGWGCSLEMATINSEEVKNFIKKRALHGPEGHYPRNGSFKHGLLKKAEYPEGSNGADRNVCPQ